MEHTVRKLGGDYLHWHWFPQVSVYLDWWEREYGAASFFILEVFQYILPPTLSTHSELSKQISLPIPQVFFKLMFLFFISVGLFIMLSP